MITKEECFFVGAIFKTHGVNGEVSVKLDTDSPNDFSEMESVFLEITKKLVPFFIEAVRIVSNETAIIKFCDIDSEPEAKELISCSLFLPEEVLPELQGDSYYYHDLVGMNVIDIAFGRIGIVSEIIEYPNHRVLQVMKGGQEVLIPLADEIVKTVDKDKKLITVDCPEGLLELYL